MSRQNNVDSASTAEIHNHVTGLKVREAGGVATTPREVESNRFSLPSSLKAISIYIAEIAAYFLRVR
ncbi:MAG: hypothetical protein QMD66_01945 [Actinomycetota bacterium]|nr:hypothetical protein [Actinomycetota bacterium]MDI6821629.1 hypothetical protein [Actinomycetota bacterium]